jgi:hypothetical protein
MEDMKRLQAEQAAASDAAARAQAAEQEALRQQVREIEIEVAGMESFLSYGIVDDQVGEQEVLRRQVGEIEIGIELQKIPPREAAQGQRIANNIPVKKIPK